MWHLLTPQYCYVDLFVGSQEFNTTEQNCCVGLLTISSTLHQRRLVVGGRRGLGQRAKDSVSDRGASDEHQSRKTTLPDIQRIVDAMYVHRPGCKLVILAPQSWDKQRERSQFFFVLYIRGETSSCKFDCNFWFCLRWRRSEIRKLSKIHLSKIYFFIAIALVILCDETMCCIRFGSTQIFV